MSKIRDILKKNVRSPELIAGVHDHVHLVGIDIDDRKDKSGNRIKKQLFLTFKKLNEEGEVVGEKEISFFDIDPVKDFALDNLCSYVGRVEDLLKVFISDKDIDKGYDPLSALLDDGEDSDDVKDEFKFDAIKKSRLKKMSGYKKVEKAVQEHFYELLKDEIGHDSVPLRLKLEEDKNNYVNLPRYGAFVEKASVKKKNSKLIAKIN